MIYTQDGEPIEITGYCGKHLTSGFRFPVMLVRVQLVGGQGDRYEFAYTLKADDGATEIDAAIDAASEVNLTGEALKAAIHEAA